MSNTPNQANTPTTDDVEIDKILINFAKRVEKMQRGETYGWEDEKQAILALMDKSEREARADENQIASTALVGIGIAALDYLSDDNYSNIGRYFKVRISQLTTKQKEES